MHADEVSLKFLDLVEHDIRHGGLRRVEDYQRLLPGQDAIVAEEYERLVCDRPDAQRLIGGRYRIVESLGRGGFGEVFLAEDLQMARRVAVKRLCGLYAFRDDWRARLWREAEATNRIRVDGICPVHDVGHENGVPFLVMPWIQGRPLDRLVAARAGHGEGPVQLGAAGDAATRCREFLLFVERVAEALHAAHASGVVHRDVKPANLIVRTDGRPEVIDFGLAWLATADPTATRSLTLGTPAYSAPEVQEDGAVGHDPRLDVWSLGVVLFEGLTLRRPFAARPGKSLERSVREDPVPRIDRAFGRDLQAVIETALAVRPGERYASMREFAEDLRRVRTGQPVMARRTNRLRRGLQRLRARPDRVAAAAILLAVVVAVGAWLVRHQEHVVVARTVASLAASTDAIVQHNQRLAQFGLATRERVAQARLLLRAVRELRSGVGASAEIDRSLARVLLAVGRLELELRERELGIAHVAEARSVLLEAAAVTAPSVADRRNLILAEILLGDGLCHVGDAEDALAHYRRAQTMDLALLRERPDDARCVSDVAFGHVRIGFVHGLLGDHAVEREQMGRAIGLLLRAEQLASHEPQRRKHTATAMLDFAQALWRDADARAAERERMLDGAEQRLHDLARQLPRDYEVWNLLYRTAQLRMQGREPRDLEQAELDRMCGFTDRMVQLEPDLPAALCSRGVALGQLARWHVVHADRDAAIAVADQGQLVLRRAHAAGEVGETRRHAIHLMCEQAALFVDLQRPQLAAARLAEAQQLAASDFEQYHRDHEAAVAYAALLLSPLVPELQDPQRAQRALQRARRTARTDEQLRELVPIEARLAELSR